MRLHSKHMLFLVLLLCLKCVFFCLIMARDVINNFLCFLAFSMVIFFGCSILRRELGLCPNTCKVRFV